jgi:hypothetical protein
VAELSVIWLGWLVVFFAWMVRRKPLKQKYKVRKENPEVLDDGLVSRVDRIE